MSGETRVIYGLWRSDGTRVWSSEMRYDTGVGAMPALAAGDVDGDGSSEMILGIALTEYDYSEDTPYARPTRMQSLLGIYDLDRKCLAQRELEDTISSVLLLDNVAGGKDVIIQTTRKIIRLAFDPGATAPQQQGHE